ncbi:sulfotransferase family 2 domain-containing protein [Microbulbifer sp. JMSA008]|uniref:sulfotransferase family 2 domain-containing protein n=1 Tax=Microbulbifer sp. JMSA008 TaxID=3243373 RepID=UPI004039397E
MKPIVFVHIPKTAGTSFRQGLDYFFGKKKICLDYGVNSAKTSSIVKSWVESERDGWHFANAFNRQGYQLLTGHFHSTKYANIFGVGRMITFLRDPVQRVVSEYNHLVKNSDHEESFQSFYRRPENINRQLRLVGRKSWAEFGFIGFVESYKESLRLLNRKFNINIPYLHKNINKNKTVESCMLSIGQIEELNSLNAEELEFYNRARFQFDWRLRLINAKVGYVSGSVTSFEAGKLKGWAIAENLHEAVLIQARMGGNVIAECKANEYRPYFKAQEQGRGGFVGFSLEIDRDIKINTVECVVAATGQPLLNNVS